jgi:putative selenate reductase FAD-binding subunit
MITDIARPKTVTEALRAGSVPGSAWLGGGTWLNSGRAGDVTTLVSLEHLGLDSIHAGQGRCTVGAAATFQAIADNDHVPAGLRDAVRLTASRTLRNMVTVGGELGCSPADSAVIPLLIALDAEVALAGRKKPVQIRTFLNEKKRSLILSVSFDTGQAAGVRVVSRTSHSPRCLVVAVSGARIVASDCRGQVVLLERPQEFEPRPDVHASADYKRYMTGVLVSDLRAALARGADR